MPPCLVNLCSATDRGLAYLAGRVAFQCQLARSHDTSRRTQSSLSNHQSAQRTTLHVSENDFLDFVLDNGESKKSASIGSKNSSLSDASKSRSTAIHRDLKKRGTRPPGKDRPGNTLQDATKPQRRLTALDRRSQQQPRIVLPGGGTSAERLRRLRQEERRLTFQKALSAQPLREKWIPLRSLSRRSDVYHSLWNVNIARLSARYDKHYNLAFMEPITPYLDQRTPDIVEKIFERATGETGCISIDALGEITDGRKPAIVWAEIALWLLANDPARAPEFLLATHVGPMYPPLKWVEDTVEYLARHYHYSDVQNKEQHMTKLLSTIVTLSDRADNGEHMRVRGSAFRHIIRYCSGEQLVSLSDAIRTNEIESHPLIYTHLATKFAQEGDLEKALDSLLEAHTKGCRLQSYAFLSTCATLLRTSMEQPGGMRLCLRVIDNLVEIGVKLNTQLTNIIMLNAVNSGERDTAMSIFSSMTANGIKPDEYTFAILLKLCKTDIDNAASLRDIIQLAVESTDVRGNVILATEILHCLAMHHSKHNPDTAFKTVADAFVELFDPASLKALGISMPRRTGVDESNGSLQPPLLPTTYTLNVLLSVYLQHASVHEARRLYLRWMELIKLGDAQMSALAKTTHLHNAFMKSFITRKDSLMLATEVLKHMQKQADSEAQKDSTERQSGPGATPDVYSWSVLLEGFLKHGQDKSAKQVMDHMRKQGIEPTDVTWNIVISGYARLQMLHRVVEGISGMWSADRAFDEWTYKGLSRLSDRNRLNLRARMEKMEYERRLDFTPELKNDLSSRLQQIQLEEAEEEDEEVSL